MTQEQLEAAQEKQQELLIIARALASDYESIYYVDTRTDDYMEFVSQGAYEDLKIELSGTNFFEETQRNLLKVIYEDDQQRISELMHKENLLEIMKEQTAWSVVYRLVIEGEPVYYQLKIVMAEDHRHLVIGVSNVDYQVRRDQELRAVQDLANRDALTGVKSKHAYAEASRTINEEIQNGDPRPFAVAVCDVNGLKTVNDTMGHQAGDRLLLDATHIICEIFRHSPVYRTGGDEFVAVLRGHDYEARKDLMAAMEASNRQGRDNGGVVIACGIAVWQDGDLFESVFEKADAAMYINKSELKK